MRLCCATACAAAAALIGCGRGQAPETSTAESAQQEIDAYIKAMTAAGQAGAQGDEAAFRANRENALTHLKKAEQLFEDAGAATSNDPEVLAAYAKALNLSEDYDIEAQVWERLTTLRPDDPSAWLSLGRTRSLLGDKHAKAAEDAFRRALDVAKEPTDQGQAHAALGHLYLQESLFDFAREQFEQAIQLAPDEITSRIGLAALKVRDGKVAEAVRDVESIKDLKPEQLGAAQGSLAQALGDFERLRRWFPDTAEDHLAYAKLLVWGGRIPECILPLQRAAKLQPDNYVIWNFLGSIHRQLNQLDKACEDFAKSLELNPDQPRTREALQALEQGASAPPPAQPTAPQQPPGERPQPQQ